MMMVNSSAHPGQHGDGVANVMMGWPTPAHICGSFFILLGVISTSNPRAMITRAFPALDHPGDAPVCHMGFFAGSSVLWFGVMMLIEACGYFQSVAITAAVTGALTLSLSVLAFGSPVGSMDYGGPPVVAVVLFHGVPACYSLAYCFMLNLGKEDIILPIVITAVGVAYLALISVKHRTASKAASHSSEIAANTPLLLGGFPVVKK